MAVLLFFLFNAVYLIYETKIQTAYSLRKRSMTEELYNSSLHWNKILWCLGMFSVVLLSVTGSVPVSVSGIYTHARHNVFQPLHYLAHSINSLIFTNYHRIFATVCSGQVMSTARPHSSFSLPLFFTFTYFSSKLLIKSFWPREDSFCF